MLTLRSLALTACCGLAFTLAACHAKDRDQLQKFAGDLDKAAADVKTPADSGVLTLTIDAYEGAVAILPARGTAESLNLPTALTRDLNRAASVSDNGHLFLIKSDEIVAEERLDPSWQIVPGYGKGPIVRFTLNRTKTKGNPLQIAI